MIQIRINKNQNVWFTSDTHYNHPNIVRGESNWTNKDVCRNFDTLEQMNNLIVGNINDKVEKNDILIHVGDWSFGGIESVFEFRKRLICQNIYLFLGNHDDHIDNNKDNSRSLFTKVSAQDMIEVIINNGKNKKSDRYKYFVGHYPLVSWREMNRGIPNIFGHVHLPSELKIQLGKSMDCGMDGNNFEVYNYTEINKLLQSQPIRSLFSYDHHIREVR